MRKRYILGFAAAVAAIPVSASAQGWSFTEFFKTSDLTPLAKSADVLNLEAQMSTGKATTDVNSFDDFFLINGPGRLVVNFDKKLASKGSTAIPGWIGVARYSNHTISADLQAGFEAVKKKYALKNGLGHVTVYKTLNTASLVYDYAVEKTPGSTQCQEYLYVPSTGETQLGMTVSCLWTLKNVSGALKRSGGQLMQKKVK